jgi:hypothetical protein
VIHTLDEKSSRNAACPPLSGSEPPDGPSGDDDDSL